MYFHCFVFSFSDGHDELRTCDSFNVQLRRKGFVCMYAPVELLTPARSNPSRRRC